MKIGVFKISGVKCYVLYKQLPRFAE